MLHNVTLNKDQTVANLFPSSSGSLFVLSPQSYSIALACALVDARAN
jgi:hypothetical protein